MPQPVHSSTTRSHRFHLLDGLRGVAAILVAIYHVPLLIRPGLLLENGWLAVDFFFCLSGFVIAYSYQKRFEKGMKIKDFVAARLIRLYPLYLAGSLIGVASVVLVGTHATKVHFSAESVFSALPFALLMLPNFTRHWPDAPAFPLNIPGWSLYYELLANLAFAGLLRLRRASTAVITVIIAVSLAIFVAAIARHTASLNVGWTLNTLGLGYARVALSFCLGVLVFRFYAKQRGPSHGMASAIFYPAIATLGVLAIIGPSFSLFAHVTAQLTVITLAFPLLVYAGARSTVPQVLIAPCAFLGDISYPIYVLHSPLVLPFGGSKTTALLQSHSAIAHGFLPLLLIAVIVIAWVAGRLYDRPIRLWLTRRYNAASAPAL